MMATGSSSLPSRTSEDADTSSNSCVSPVSTVNGDNLSDVLPVSNLQLTDRTQEAEGDSLLHTSSSISELAGSGTSIDDLPDELMLEIFSYMSISENINVLQEVCTRWKTLAQDAHLWIHKEYVVRYKTSEEEATATFAAVPQLRTVILEKEVSPGVFEALSGSCPHLTTLETHWHQMLTYSEAENLFDRCKEIRKLTVSDWCLRADMRFLNAVAQLADLRVLHLQQCDSEDMEIPLCVLADGCPHLCDLDLGRHYCSSYRIQDAEYFINSHKHVLWRLRIRWTSVEGRPVSPLLPVCAETLQCLELDNYDAVEIEEAAEALAAIGQLHSLRQLRFDVTDWDARHLVPTVFEGGGLPNLQQLWFNGIMVDETTRALSKHCPELRELELWCCEGHTDALFEPLHRLKKLEILKIYPIKCLGGKAMSYISKLPALHTLHFGYTNFERLKPSVDCILEISGLRRLSFMESMCWEIPFDKFPGRLVNLRELEIDYCDGDRAVLDRIRAQMPDLRVEGCLGASFSDEELY